jgi:hypothetical protein
MDQREESSAAADSDTGTRLKDSDFDADERNETPLERLDRNWGDLLQELRVVQTGVQLLTGFLLTLPFQARFEKLANFQQNIYLATVALSIISTSLLIAPVAIHRWLFRQHARKVMVSAAHRLALAGVGFLGLAITGVVLLTFDVVRDSTVGIIAAGLTALLLISLWIATPIGLQRRASGHQGFGPDKIVRGFSGTQAP